MPSMSPVSKPPQVMPTLLTGMTATLVTLMPCVFTVMR
jgi:hypothetical protein